MPTTTDDLFATSCGCDAPPWPSPSAWRSWPGRWCSPTPSARPSTTCSPTCTRARTPSCVPRPLQGPQTGDQRGRSSRLAGRTISRARVAGGRGQVLGYARLIGKDGKALGDPANGAPTLGAAGDLPSSTPSPSSPGRAAAAPPTRSSSTARAPRRPPGGRRQHHRAGPGRHRSRCDLGVIAGSAMPTALAGPPSSSSPCRRPAARGGAREVRRASPSSPPRRLPGSAGQRYRRPAGGCEAVTGAAVTKATRPDAPSMSSSTPSC